MTFLCCFQTRKGLVTSLTSNTPRHRKAPPRVREPAVGSAAGGLAGALVGLGIPEYEAKRYEGKIREGNILISVHTDDGNEVNRAKEIFKREGAEDISYTGEASVPSR